MRCMCTTLALFLSLVLSGCRTQTATLTNPFLAPDRVPPPATRTLMPGTAQPYYPGDPVPNSPAVAPPGAIPTYTQPPGQVPVPNGWNSTPQPIPNTTQPVYPPMGAVQPSSAQIALGPVGNENAEIVRIQTDQQNLRFAQQAPSESFIAPPNQQVSPVWPQQIQPQPGQVQDVTPTTTYPVQQMSHQVPVVESRDVQIRALPAGYSSYQEEVSTPVTKDGFRPQGSSLSRTAARPTRESDSSRQDVASQFGFDPNYEWLRGQLEYSEATDQWKLRYIPIQQNPDQFGGSVLIANPQVLGGVRPGEHVQLRGKLQPRTASGRAFAPIYTVSVVQRQQI